MTEQNTTLDVLTGIVNASPDFFVALDNTYKTVFANDALLSRLGYVRDEMLNRSYLPLVVPCDQRTRVAQRFSELFGDVHQSTVTNDVVAKRGTTIRVLWHGCRINDRLIAGWGTPLDEASRLGRSDDGRRNLQELLDVCDSLLLPAFTKDRSLRYTRCNDSFAGYLAVDRDEILGRTVFDVAPRELAEIYDERDRRLLAKAPSTQQYRSFVRAGCGNRRPVRFTKYSYVNEYGIPSGIVGIVEDLKRAHDLEKAVAEYRRSEITGQHLFGAIHDTRNYVHVISGFADLALQEISDAGEPACEHLESIRDAAERAAESLGGALGDVRSVETNPAGERCSLSDTIAEAVHMLKGVQSGRIGIRGETDSDLPLACRKSALLRVLVNLGRNAIEAMRNDLRGDICIRGRKKVSIVEHPQGATEYLQIAEITVADTGPGIQREERSHIFDAMFTSHPHDGGTGLGLGIVRRIVEHYGGTVGFEHAPDGTTVTVLLPTAAEAVLMVSACGAPSSELIDQELSRGRDVIVCDDEVVALGVCEESDRIAFLYLDTDERGGGPGKLPPAARRIRPGIEISWRSFA